MLHVPRGRNDRMSKGLDRLDHARHACCGRGVTYAGLHRSQRAVVALRSELSMRGGEGLRLHGVAQPGTGPMSLGVSDRPHVDARPSIDCRREIGLRLSARRGESVRGAIVVHRRAADDCKHAVAVALGGGQRLQDEDSRPLTRDEPIREAVERTACSGR